MAITTDGWLDWATRKPGPADKVYSTPNKAIGYVPHSAVGYYHGWASRLFSTERREDGRYSAYAAASVHGWINYDGSVVQHYPFTASCWASGSAYPNTHFIAFENEGGHNPHDEPLTRAQLHMNGFIIRELAAWKGWPSIQRPISEHDTIAQLYEHNECVRWGSAPTACPSSRIDWPALLALIADAPTPPTPQVWTPTNDEYIRALISAGHHIRHGWRLNELEPGDKQALRMIAESANEQA